MHDHGAVLRIACVGGGPGGLFAAIAITHALPNATIDVFERNRADDVFGFGVVFSDATLDEIDRVDPVLRDALAAEGRRWDRIEVRSGGESHGAGGNGMSAIHRRVLLSALQERATELGARLHFQSPVTVDALDATGEYDLIIGADGANSAVRERFIDQLAPSVTEAAVKFIWFGTTYDFDGLTFLHERGEHGNFAVHAYPIGSGLSTFIVETDEDTWRRAGLDEFDTSQPPGVSDEKSQRYLERLFADQIDGHPLVANNSRWANFRTRRTERWSARGACGTPVVLLGDAVHTAHFSVGSGTKMAMEDAAALAYSLAQQPTDLDAPIRAYEAARRPQVTKIQDSALPSLSWWDHFADYHRALEPWQFGVHFFTRAISAEKIRVRDPAFVGAAGQRWASLHTTDPLDTPLRLGDHLIPTRLLTVVAGADGELLLSAGGATVYTGPGSSAGADGIAICDAPQTDSTSLTDIDLERLDRVCATGPSAIVVRGGTPLTRVLCAERIRLRHGITAVLVDDAAAVRARRSVDMVDNATTLVLSGRADAVGFEDTHSTASVTHSEVVR
ncbi:FAD-dependent monooxygenase [Nocardia sp. NPDC052254]|uniref:FAD-dependent monooxygenase n=1 Tax=Nocardia sp. NPDC052254 TaxID=3155681 RepID=UPI0034127DBD